jgi:peptidyl-prolyl cis-trans isomerase C
VSYRKLIVISVAVMSLAGLTACKGNSTGVGGKSAKPAGQTLVDVNGIVITTADFKKELENLPPYLKPMAESAEGKKQLIDTMVVRELVLKEAQKEGIDKTQAVADKLEDLKKQLILQAYVKKKVEEQANITDADLQKFYDQNKDKFKTGEQVRASHILVKTEPEAKEILKQLKGGASFEELAKKNSIDASAGAKGGDLGWFGKGSMIPEFEKAAFAMKEGELSGIVKTQFGYHIIKVTGKRPAGIRPFAEVKDQIRDNLLPQKQQDVLKKITEDMKKNVKYTINEEALKSLGGASASAAQSTPAPESKQK